MPCRFPLFGERGETLVHWYVPAFTLIFAAAVWLQTQLNPVFQFAWFLPAFAAACILAAAAVRHRPGRGIVFSLLLGGCAGFAYAGLFFGMVHGPLASLDGQKAQVTAVVTGYAERYEDEQRVPLKILTNRSGISFWMPWFHTTAYVPLTDEELIPGDEIEAKLSFYVGSDTGGFDRDAYYAGKNMHILASCDNIMQFQVRKPESLPLTLRPLLWAQTLKARLMDLFDAKDAAFLQALMLGDRSGLPVSTEQDFSKAGLSHVMAVSGMHVGFLVLFFMTILGRRIGLCASLAALLVFVPMAGATPSVIRAAVMYAFVTFGFFARRDYSALHALCAALLLLLLHNPYAIESLSLQLSFLAALGLILFGKRLQTHLMAPFRDRTVPRWAMNLLRSLTGAVSCSVCATIFTAPVLLRSFGYVSVASILANMLTIGVFALLFVMGFLACLMGGLPLVGSLLCACIHGLCVYVFAVAHGVGSIRPLLLDWDFWFVRLGLVLVYTTLIGAWLARRRLAFGYAAAVSCTALLLTVGANADALARKYEIHVFSADSGQCIAASYGVDCLAVIDCAANGSQSADEMLAAYMDWNGLRQIDLLVVTSLDKTHARDLPALLQAIPVRQIVIPPDSKQSDLSDEVMALAQEMEIPVSVWEGSGELPAGDSRLGLSIIGGVPRKLGVRLRQGEQDVLTLHALTAKMLEELMQTQELTAETLVLNEDLADEPQLVQQLHPAQLCFPTRYLDSGAVGDIPMITTKQSGDLTMRSILPHGGV